MHIGYRRGRTDWWISWVDLEDAFPLLSFLYNLTVLLHYRMVGLGLSLQTAAWETVNTVCFWENFVGLGYVSMGIACIAWRLR